MRKTFLAAVVWLAVLAPGFAKADPILTPLITTALIEGGIVGTTAAATTVASIVSFTLTAGPAHGTLMVIR